MPKRERTKDFPIGEYRFRAELPDAQLGTYILRQITTGRIVRDRAVSFEVDAEIMSKCWLIEQQPGGDTPMRFFTDNKWLNDELRFEIEVLRELTNSVTEWWFADFFAKAKAEEEKAKNSLSPQSDTQTTSAPISGVQS